MTCLHAVARLVFVHTFWGLWPFVAGMHDVTLFLGLLSGSSRNCSD